MKLNLRVKFESGEAKEIVASAKDLVAFENKFNKSVAKFEEEFRLTDLLWLAWCSEHRVKATNKEFETWLDEVDSIEVSENSPK